jgi:hypothetical protein
MGGIAESVGDAKKNRRLLWRLLGILAAFWLVMGVVFGPKYFRKMGASWYVNACKEQGGCWDVEAARCQTDRSKCPQPQDTVGAPDRP